jgi:hypothetical protein
VARAAVAVESARPRTRPILTTVLSLPSQTDDDPGGVGTPFCRRGPWSASPLCVGLEVLLPELLDLLFDAIRQLAGIHLLPLGVVEPWQVQVQAEQSESRVGGEGEVVSLGNFLQLIEGEGYKFLTARDIKLAFGL